MKRVLIQPRDTAFLIGVYRHGFLLRDHAWKLYFSECELRRATRRLLALKQHNLIAAHHLPLGAFALGIEGFLPHYGQLAYRLGEAGIPLVAQALELNTTSVRRRLRTAPSFIGHCVAVTAVLETLSRFQTTQNYQVEDFKIEREAGHQYEYREGRTSPWKRAEIRPDALVWIQRDGMVAPWFVEADMSTQSKAAVNRKLSAYFNYCKTGTFTRRFGDTSFRLLLVTTSPARRDTLVDLVESSDLAGVPGVAVTTFNDFCSHGLFSPMWKETKPCIVVTAGA